MNERIACCSCGEGYAPSEVEWMNGQPLCRDCLEEQTVTCSRCGERIWIVENEETQGPISAVTAMTATTPLGKVVIE